MHEDDARRLIPLANTTRKKHSIATFMGTDAAVTKVAITEQLNGKDFYPTSFVLPKERKALAKFVKRDPNSYWISKPRNVKLLCLILDLHDGTCDTRGALGHCSSRQALGRAGNK